MTLTHIHLKNCTSTQDYIRQLFSVDQKILVSCDRQISGHGTFNKKWDHLVNSVAFSMTISPAFQPTLTSIEMGVLLVDFFQNKFDLNLSLKWPNDIINQFNQKCGGILIEVVKTEKFILGIGLNIKKDEDDIDLKKYLNEGGYIFNQNNYILDSNYKEELPKLIFNYIEMNRIKSQSEIRNRWMLKCNHLKKQIEINEGEKTFSGIFEGIGEYGEALITTRDHKQLSFYRGTVLNPP